MKGTILITVILALVLFSGCGGGAVEEAFPAEGRQLLSVDFEQGQTLRYKFVSDRKIGVDWSPMMSGPESKKGKVEEYIESTEMVIAYRGVEIDPYGLTTIEATVESVKARRSSRTGQRTPNKDAVQSLANKSCRLTIGPNGAIEDYSGLKELIREVGEKAFRAASRQGRIKEPDMIGDFTTTQWFLWDCISSIEKPSAGVAVGQSWQSQLPVPTPMIIKRARDVTYTLDEIRETEEGKMAVISCGFSLAESLQRYWPLPYEGSFQMSGTFGFLRNYKVLELEGQGQEMFNIDKGRMEQYSHEYQVKMTAGFRRGISISTKITINQSLTMELIE